MIINQCEELVVPDKTIAFFPIIPADGIKPFDLKNIDLFLKPLNTNHKRDWFTPQFYKCLPLAISILTLCLASLFISSSVVKRYLASLNLGSPASSLVPGTRLLNFKKIRATL
jgi:hypothetical protein